MSKRVEDALAKRNKGYNCAQAVGCAYCDLAGVDEETMFRATEGLGIGCGGFEGTCGAVTGACVLAGFKNSSANMEKPDSKKETLRLSKAITKKFYERNGELTCKVLKGIESGVVIRTCPGCVEDAAEIVEEVLFAEELRKES